MSNVQVVLAPPHGWSETEVDRPRIAESAGASITSWQARRSADGKATLVAGCVSTPVPGWVEDMRPAVEGRTTALAGAAAAKITGSAVDARPIGDGLFALRPAARMDGEVIGRARTFVGFDEAHVFTCFAACVHGPAAEVDGQPRADAELACEGSVVGARLDGSRAAPPPGIGLYTATWAVHHPRPFAVGAASVLVVVGALAVAFRRRPRFHPLPRRR